ncbi:MAG: hypothetical protein IJK04_07395, partial [Kiritimatiellae bacterium]|nr:hypothetical protein [Kiritimatiellia bacterium]
MKYNIKPFAIAATFAATFAALAADPAPRSSDYLVAGFENYAAGTAIPGQTVEDVCAWTSTDPDGATVVAHASAPAMPNDVTPPKPFVDFGDNYLDVDSPAEVACTLSTPTTSPESTFIDAMVQFNLASPNEDPTTDVSDAKFMMWMRNDGDSTNLYVKGSRFTWRDEEGATNDTLEFSDAIFRLQPSGYESIAPGTWHRVTITHFNNIFNGGDLSIGGFTIAIDGCSV